MFVYGFVLVAVAAVAVAAAAIRQKETTSRTLRRFLGSEIVSLVLAASVGIGVTMVVLALMDYTEDPIGVVPITLAVVAVVAGYLGIKAIGRRNPIAPETTGPVVVASGSPKSGARVPGGTSGKTSRKRAA